MIYNSISIKKKEKTLDTIKITYLESNYTDDRVNNASDFYSMRMAMLKVCYCKTLSDI